MYARSRSWWRSSVWRGARNGARSHTEPSRSQPSSICRDPLEGRLPVAQPSPRRGPRNRRSQVREPDLSPVADLRRFGPAFPTRSEELSSKSLEGLGRKLHRQRPGPAIVICGGTPWALDQSPSRRNGSTRSSTSAAGTRMDWNRGIASLLHKSPTVPDGGSEGGGRLADRLRGGDADLEEKVLHPGRAEDHDPAAGARADVAAGVDAATSLPGAGRRGDRRRRLCPRHRGGSRSEPGPASRRPWVHRPCRESRARRRPPRPSGLLSSRV
jgi:hypothetical protein